MPKKGNIPWNKGLKFPGSGNSTSFKKGTIPKTKTDNEYPCVVCGKIRHYKPTHLKRIKNTFCSKEHADLYRKGKPGANKGKIYPQIRGENHPLWKQDAGYIAIHNWVRRYKGKAKICVYCGSDKNIQWSNISYEYKRDFDDWMALCPKCHSKRDTENGDDTMSRQFDKYGHRKKGVILKTNGA